MVYPVKHKEIYDFYYSYSNPARPYDMFRNTMMRYKNRDSDTFKAKLQYYIQTPVKVYNEWVTSEGRICTNCKEHKSRDKFQNQFSTCKKCRNDKRNEWREKSKVKATVSLIL